MEGTHAPQQAFQDLYPTVDGLDCLVQDINWPENTLDEIDPQGHLQTDYVQEYALPDVVLTHVQRQRAEQLGMPQLGMDTEVLCNHDETAAAQPQQQQFLGYANLHASPYGSGPSSAMGSAPVSRRRSSAAEVDGAGIQRSLEQFHLCSAPPVAPGYASGAGAGAGAGMGASGMQHPHPEYVRLTQPMLMGAGGGPMYPPQCVPASQTRSHVASPTPPQMGPHSLSGSPHLMQRLGHPSLLSTPSSSRTPSDCSDPAAQAAAAGNFYWERCAVEGTRLHRLFDNSSAPPSGGATGRVLGSVQGGNNSVAIVDVSMVRPFMQSQSMLHYWFRTWKVPRITVSVANARNAGPGCTLCLQAITVSATDTITVVEMRGNTRMPFLGGQATFSGLMFGTTSYSHANSLFHLLATIECNGQVIDAAISTGLHVFSKNKQRSSSSAAAAAAAVAAGLQPSRPRTGSQWLETSGAGSPVLCGGSGPASSAHGDDEGGAGGSCQHGVLRLARLSDGSAGGLAQARGSPKRRSSESSPLLAHSRALGAPMCGGGGSGADSFGLATDELLSDVKRQRSHTTERTGSPLGSPSVGSPAQLRRERVPCITVHHARELPAATVGAGYGSCHGTAGGDHSEVESPCELDGSRRASATGFPPRPQRPTRSPLGSEYVGGTGALHAGAGANSTAHGTSQLLDVRSRRGSDSGTSPANARTVDGVEAAAPTAPAAPPPPLRLRAVRCAADGSVAFAPALGAQVDAAMLPASACGGCGGGATTSSGTAAGSAALPAWLTDEEQCHCLRSSRVFTIVLHVATGASGAASPCEPPSGAADGGGGSEARPSLDISLPEEQLLHLHSLFNLAEGHGADAPEPRHGAPAHSHLPSPLAPPSAGLAPAPSPLSISIRYLSTNLDDELGGGGSLAGAVGLPVSALFDSADAALIAAALGNLWPAAGAPAAGGHSAHNATRACAGSFSSGARASGSGAGGLGMAGGLPAECAGGSVDLGELALRRASLPGAYAGLRIHAVLLCTPAPALEAEGAEQARPHVVIACRALASGERVAPAGAPGLDLGGASGAAMAEAPALACAATADSSSGALAVLSELGDVVARCDGQMRIRYISPNCDELAGYAPHELLGLELTACGWLLHPDDARQLRATALDPAHRHAAEQAAAAARAQLAGGAKARRRQPTRLRALVRMACRGAATYSWVEMVLTHTYAPAGIDELTGQPLPQALEAVTVSMREKEWRHYDDGTRDGGAGALGAAAALGYGGATVPAALPGAASSSPSMRRGDGGAGRTDEDFHRR